MTVQVSHAPPDGVSAYPMAGTPSALPPEQVADALDTIEFLAVLDLVARHAAGPLGAARVRSRAPSDDLSWIRAELERVGEVAALLRRGDGLLAEPIPDVSRALARLRLDGSVLEGVELAGFRRTLAAARLVEADLRRVAPLAPATAALARPLPERALERRLEQAVDEDGQLLDTASPRLAAARREVHAARARLIRRLEQMLRELDAQSATPGGTVTVRGGRYVIPVRRDSRTRPVGIIHDESASQETLFVEPSVTVELGNALREAEVEEERETLRVLRELTELLRPAWGAIRDVVEMCVAVDDLVARARYAVAAGGEVPAVSAAPAPLTIVTGRHPLLLAQGETVVPYDLMLDAHERTLLVSGPNTGGKTVLLKATALAVALAQSGIVPPVGPGTRLPVFRRLFADIGDRQSIAASLSTFSAHAAMLRRILDEADDATLVLLDEVGSGTDPAEGAALAAAALASLTRRGAVTLATTHLGALKDLASRESGVVNGSLQFDAATLTPTYRFVKGIPGRSYGLAIARRLGVAGDVLADAEARVPAAEKRLDDLLARVEERDRELAEQLAAAESQRLDAESLAARLARQAETQNAREVELRRRERDAERQGREAARRFLLQARERVEEALGLARTAADQEAARAARRLVEEGIREEAEREDQATAERGDGGTRERGNAGTAEGQPNEIAVGSRVRVPTGATGQVTEIRSDRKLVVAVGAVRMVVDAASVAPAPGEPASAHPSVSPSPVPSFSRSAVPPTPLEIDLRGMTGDEAELATVAAIDGAVLAEHPYLRVIHGKGTGVVRERVRRVAAADRRVTKFDFAPANQGGTGVTILEFGG